MTRAIPANTTTTAFAHSSQKGPAKRATTASMGTPLHLQPQHFLLKLPRNLARRRKRTLDTLARRLKLRKRRLITAIRMQVQQIILRQPHHNTEKLYTNASNLSWNPQFTGSSTIQRSETSLTCHGDSRSARVPDLYPRVSVVMARQRRTAFADQGYHCRTLTPQTDLQRTE